VYYGAGIMEARSCAMRTCTLVGAPIRPPGRGPLLRICAALVMLVRGSGLGATMSKYLVDRIEQTPNIEVLCGAACQRCEDRST